MLAEGGWSVLGWKGLCQQSNCCYQEIPGTCCCYKVVFVFVFVFFVCSMLYGFPDDHHFIRMMKVLFPTFYVSRKIFNHHLHQLQCVLGLGGWVMDLVSLV